MEKFTIYLVLSVAMSVGSWLPTLFGFDMFSGWSLLGGAIGGFAGVYLIYRMR